MNEFNERDLFAALAMCGQMANAKLNPRTTYAELVTVSYDLADAMLKEKAKRDDRQEG
jgi:hypothetical protein